MPKKERVRVATQSPGLTADPQQFIYKVNAEILRAWAEIQLEHKLQEGPKCKALKRKRVRRGYSRLVAISSG